MKEHDKKKPHEMPKAGKHHGKEKGHEVRGKEVKVAHVMKEKEKKKK